MRSVLAPTYTVTARRDEARRDGWVYLMALIGREVVRSTAVYPTWEAARNAGEGHAQRLLAPVRS